MFASIKNYCHLLSGKFDEIPAHRKQLLEKISLYIIEKKKAKKTVQLVYICTHNSRRSHFGQIWAAVAAKYYQAPDIQPFSGGTEATEFNINAINTLKKIGFEVHATDTGKNPVYSLKFSETENPIKCFSKTYDNAVNPKSGFAAIMTCGEAEENCPFIAGAELRIATTYEDPKAFDQSDIKEQKYFERCEQIALETLFVFSKII